MTTKEVKGGITGSRGQDVVTGDGKDKTTGVATLP
jgi:hypothetical protein